MKKVLLKCRTINRFYNQVEIGSLTPNSSLQLDIVSNEDGTFPHTSVDSTINMTINLMPP